MSRWFRYYDDALNDPKVQRLSGDMFKAWVNLLCVASKNGGEIPSLAEAAFSLRLPETKTGAIVADLAKRELLDPVEGGYFRPHNWGKRQYKTDVTDPTNAERQKRFRDRHRNTVTTVTDKRPDTEQIQSQNTEQTEAKNFNGEGRRAPLPHGTISRSRGTVFIRAGTNDWAAYAADYRANKGVEPEPNEDGGFWFKTAGAAPLPVPKRLTHGH